MDKETVVERVKQYAELVKKSFNVKRIILFGSYVNGVPKEYSDIDVAVIVDSVEDDFLTSAAKLFRLTDGIDVRIEPVLLEEKPDPSGFLEEIIKTGEIIYSAD